MPQPVADSAGGTVFPQPHPAEAERGGPVRFQNRFSALESTEVDGSGVEVFPMTDDAAVGVLVETPRRRPSRRVVLNPEIQDTPRSIQDRRGQTPEGRGPRRVGVPQGGGPKILRFFFALSRLIFALFVFLWVSSRGILVVFLKARTLQCARFLPGVSHNNPSAQMGTFEGPGLHKNHKNSTRRH